MAQRCIRGELACVPKSAYASDSAEARTPSQYFAALSNCVWYFTAPGGHFVISHNFLIHPKKKETNFFHNFSECILKTRDFS